MFFLFLFFWIICVFVFKNINSKINQQIAKKTKNADKQNDEAIAGCSSDSIDLCSTSYVCQRSSYRYVSFISLCERAISIQRYADDEVCHVLWEHNDLSIADDLSMNL